jgi:hypothetical protein
MLKPPPCERPLRNIGEWSVVRLPDGRLGIKRPYSIQPNTALVRLSDGTDRLLSKTTQVLLLARPEDLAMGYVRTAEAAIRPGPARGRGLVRPPAGDSR